eukprot:5194147-Pyramimonas_sp.AAC.1
MAFSPAAKKRKGDNAASVVGSPGAASAQSGAQVRGPLDLQAHPPGQSERFLRTMFTPRPPTNLFTRQVFLRPAPPPVARIFTSQGPPASCCCTPPPRPLPGAEPARRSRHVPEGASEEAQQRADRGLRLALHQVRVGRVSRVPADGSLRLASAARGFPRGGFGHPRFLQNVPGRKECGERRLPGRPEGAEGLRAHHHLPGPDAQGRRGPP